MLVAFSTARSAHANKHLYKYCTTQVEVLHAGIAGRVPGQQGLTGAWRAHQNHHTILYNCAPLLGAIIITVSLHTCYQHDTEEVVSIERNGLSVFVLHRTAKLIIPRQPGYNEFRNAVRSTVHVVE